MTLTVNGKPRDVQAATLAELFAELGVNTAKKAVELNGAIVPASAFASTPVAERDAVEIIQFVGGG